MKIINTHSVVFNEECDLQLMEFDNEDRAKWKILFDKWKELKMGMRDYKSREPNFPEGLSEVAFCLYSGSKRLLKLRGKASSSFDTYNIVSGKAEQIKATSVMEDLTSFGPKSKWDDLYFLDFFNEGKLDGTFNVFLIPTPTIHTMQVNALATFLDHQSAGKRPRLKVKGIIRRDNILPIATNVKVW